MTLPIGINFKRQAGFVLTELIIVVIIIGTLSLFALPNFRKFSRGVGLERAGRNLSQTIRFAHFHSVSEGKKYRIYFDLEKSGFWVEKSIDDTGKFTKFTTSLIKERTLGRDIEFLKIITPRGESFMGQAHLDFSPDGGSENCRIYLQNGEKKRNTIVISAPTSRVAIYDYEYNK